MLVEWLLIGTWPFWLVTAAIVAAIIAAVEHEKGFWATVCFVGYLVALHLAGGVDLLIWAKSHVEWLVGGAVGYLVIGAAWGVAKWWFFTKKRAAEAEENYRKARKTFLQQGILHPDDVAASKLKQPAAGGQSDLFHNFVRLGEYFFGPNRHEPVPAGIRVINLPDATEETPVPPEMRAAWQAIVKDGWYRNQGLELRITPPRPNDHKSTILTWMTFWPASLSWTLLNDPIRAAFRHIYTSLSRTLQDISNRAFSHISDMQTADTKQDPPPSAGTADSGPIPPGSSGTPEPQSAIKG